MKQSFLPAMRWLILLPFLLLNACRDGENKDQAALVQKVLDKYYALNGGFNTPAEAWGNYTLDLTFEAMLAYDRACGQTGYSDSVLNIMSLRGLTPGSIVEYSSQPFGCLTFALFESTGDTAYLKPFLEETARMRNGARFSVEGGILHEYRQRSGLLIDYLQNYASRLAKAGMVSGNELFFEEAVHQFELYDSLARRPADGLYAQGRGYLENPEALSPGAWSRGQGWIIRGLVSTMTYLPEHSEYMKRMQVLLESYVDSLVRRQADSGLWHQLVHLPFSESAPETSGTGFIAYYLALAISQGYLAPEPYIAVVERAVDGVKSQITEDGSVLNGCPGPGPIVSTEKYYRAKGTANESHLFATTIYALAADCLINKIA